MCGKTLVALVVLTALASGCLDFAQPGDPATDSAGKPGDTTGPKSDGTLGTELEPATYRGYNCSHIMLQAVTTEDRAANYLPENFSSGGLPIGLPQFQVEHRICDQIVIGNSTVVIPDYSEFAIYLIVNPPQEQAPPSGWPTSLILGIWANAPEIVDLLARQGVQAREGSVDWTSAGRNEVFQVVMGTAVADGEPQWSFHLVMDGVPVNNTYNKRLFFETEQRVRFMDTTAVGDFGNQDYGGVVAAGDNALLRDLCMDCAAFPALDRFSENQLLHVTLGG